MIICVLSQRYLQETFSALTVKAEMSRELCCGIMSNRLKGDGGIIF